VNGFSGNTIPDQEPHHAVEAEQALLGAVFHNNAVHGLLRDRIGPEHFYEGLHARIWDAMGEELAAGRPANYFTLAPRFRDDETMVAIGGNRYLLALERNVVTVVNATGYADKILEAYRLRESAALTSELHEAIAAGDESAARQITADMQKISTGHRDGDAGMQKLSAVADALLNDISAAYQAGGAVKDYAWPGSAELASVIGGWRQGRFYIIAGRPGMGKTTTGLSWLIRTALHGHGVMFFSLEMGRNELTEIALCDLAYDRRNRVEYRDISSASVTKPGFESRFNAISAASQRLGQIPFVISDKAGQTIADIRAQAIQYSQRLASQGQRLEVICIDHLNLIRASDRYSGSKTAETEEISMSLKQLAKELQCAVICLCQLNRAVEGREEKRPSLSDLRWSGAIEQDADVVMFVYREAYYLERAKHDDMAEEEDRRSRLELVRNKLEVMFGKHRGGPCPALEFYCDMGCGVVRDMEVPR